MRIADIFIVGLCGPAREARCDLRQGSADLKQAAVNAQGRVKPL